MQGRHRATPCEVRGSACVRERERAWYLWLAPSENSSCPEESSAVPRPEGSLRRSDVFGKLLRSWVGTRVPEHKTLSAMGSEDRGPLRDTQCMYMYLHAARLRSHRPAASHGPSPAAAGCRRRCSSSSQEGHRGLPRIRQTEPIQSND